MESVINKSLRILFLFAVISWMSGPLLAQANHPRRSNQQVLDVILELKTAGKKKEALQFLSDELDRRADLGGRYGGLYVDVWREAQVRSGRVDADWAASLYNQLFVSCGKHERLWEMNDVLGNLLSTLGSAGRHGREKEVLEWWAQEQRAAGERLDASKYPDLGPALPYLPEVRLRNIPESILYWRANVDERRGGNKVHLGQSNAHVFIKYADHYDKAGRWVESMEWHFQMLRWASLEDGKPKWQLIQPWFSSIASIAEWLSWHGFDEEALAHIERGLAAPMQQSYHGRCNITMSLTRLNLLMSLNRSPKDVVEQAEDLAKKAAANKHLGIGSHLWARVVVADALLHTGRDTEALAILDELAGTGFRSARTKRLSYWIDHEILERVEEELISLLEDSRKAGNKSSEAWLYAKYADFLEKAGRLDDALAMRREVLRLYKSFHHFTMIPIHLAKLALLLERMGDGQGAEAATAEARALLVQGRLPEGRLKQVESLLANLGQNLAKVDDEEDKQAQVDFQPERSVVIPIKGASWTTLLTLTNPSGRVELGTLSSRGMPLSFTIEGEGGEVVARHAKKVEEGKARLPLQLEPQTYELIRIIADPAAEQEGELALIWTSSDGNTSVEAQVHIDAAEKGVSSSVIQAGNYRANPFYSVPMHFHYVSTEAVEQAMPMRFVASEQARVEVYALDGTPLSVDAQGNGSLWDRGDELFGAGDGKGNLRMPLENGAVSFMVLVFPDAALPEEGLTVNVEVQQGGQWVVNSQNRLMP
ncbi:MAG: hypothetical protein KJO21_06000 [Verrucomicrobiae bacterium]|nr:hypothetical protein [Verrucomicrobiae bacterium]NNJ43612.1 hypothetical protein [Akkermansiaceae bacterium]